MKKEQKLQIRGQFGKIVCQFINRFCQGLQYSDLAIMMLEQAEAVIRMCVREGYDGCRKNPRKTQKITRQIIREWAEMSKEERCKLSLFKDDE